MLSTSKGVRLRYNEQTQTFKLITDITLSKVELNVVLNNAKKQYEFRLKGTFGEKRKALQNLINNLIPAKVTQCFSDSDSEKTLFLDNQKPTTKSYFYNKQ